MADCSAGPGDKNASGDNLYGLRICWQPFVDYAWTAHGMQKTYWEKGWGYHDPCNTDLPLARTFNAIWLLNYSAEDYMNEDWSNNILHWGPRYVREQVRSYGLRPGCVKAENPAAVATTYGAGCAQYRRTVVEDCLQYRDDGYRSCRSWFFLFRWICLAWFWVSHLVCVAWGYVASWVCTAANEAFGEKRVVLWLNFFFNRDVPSRASTLVHEARHIGGKAHDADFPAWSNREPGTSGADSAWGYQGAWMYQALYLWWFYADGRRTTPAMRNLAKQRANDIINNCFATHPGFTIS